VHLGPFGCLTKLSAKRAELVQKFVPRSRVGIFHNERAQCTPLDPKLMFWCVLYHLGAFGAVWLPYESRCETGRTSTKVRATKSHRNFSFERKEYPAGTVLYSRGDEPDGFYLLEKGRFRTEYELDQGSFFEVILPGTTCGELPFFSETDRTGTVAVENDSIAWLLTRDKFNELERREGDVAKELLKVGLKLTKERMDAITSYVLVTAS